MNAITIQNIQDIAPYAGPGAIEGIRFRAVRDALGVSSLGMNVLELDPACAGHPMHDHADDDHEEVYLVLAGSVLLLVGRGEHELTVGDMVRVAPAERRKLVAGDEGATVLALGGNVGRPYQPSMGG